MYMLECMYSMYINICIYILTLILNALHYILAHILDKLTTTPFTLYSRLDKLSTKINTIHLQNIPLKPIGYKAIAEKKKKINKSHIGYVAVLLKPLHNR